MRRSVLIDTLKAVASQVIVLHHLSRYAPMADRLAAAWPRLMATLSQDGRLAVQIFFVIGGYLTALSLQRHVDRTPMAQIGQRYLRLAPALGLALLLVMVATLLVGRHLAGADWLSPLPTPGVFLVHLLLLQDVLGVPSLSAGLWYVAIDLQLFALLVWLAWGLGRSRRALADSALPVAVAALTSAAILVFGRQPALDVWAIYFLPAYGLGALTAWAATSAQARWCWWVTVAVMALEWASDPRPRPVLALATAVLLLIGARRAWPATASLWRRAVEHLSDMSYAVFLCHFAVIVLVSGVWERLGVDSLGAAVSFALITWGLSIAVGTGVQRFIDRWTPLVRAQA